MSINDSVDDILRLMHSQTVPSNKGSFGEKAVFSKCEDIYNRRGGILIHSYTYRTVDGLAGNIKRGFNDLYVENIGNYTEIDILLVTPYKMYPIEVKAYKATSININNKYITGCASKEKSPVHQNEMHMRHLYPHIFQSLPEGQCYPFIVPIVVFVDETKVVDSRTPDQKEYIKVTILNQLLQLIELHDKPYNSTLLDLPAIELRLKSAMISNEKFLPYVKR